MPRRLTLLLLLLVIAALPALAGCNVETQGPRPLGTLALASTPDPILLFAQADSSRSTADAAAATANFYGNQLTATVQQHAWNQTATWSSAYLTATQQSWSAAATAQSDQATSTAQAQMSATSFAQAATQSALDATATALWANGRAHATAMAGQAESVQMAVERERMTNQVKAAAPWVVSLLVLALALAVVWRRTRIRVIPTGQPGDKPLLLDLVDGVVTDPDLSNNPQAGTRRADLRVLPAPSPEVQAQVKSRDQAVDLATRGIALPAGTTQHPRRKIAAEMMSAAQLPIQTSVTILPADRAAALVGDVIPAIVRDVTGMNLAEEEEQK